MAFKYAFNTWVYSSFPCWVPSYSLEEAIRRIAAIGYDGIEIGCAAPHAWPAHLSIAKRRDLKSLMKDVRLVPVSLLPAPGGGPGNNPTSVLPEERTATIAHYKEVVDLAHDLGATRVLYIAGWRSFGVSYQDAWSWSLAAVTEIAKYAASKGITIVIEPTSADSNLLDTPGQTLLLREQCGQPNVKVMFDTYHAIYRNEVSSDYAFEMAAHLDHVHFADDDRLPPGEGSVDWHGVMQALKTIEFNGYITMEAGFNTRKVDPDRVARSSLTHLKKMEATLK
jgi:fructoselysine 3-epimerase